MICRDREEQKFNSGKVMLISPSNIRVKGKNRRLDTSLKFGGQVHTEVENV